MSGRIMSMRLAEGCAMRGSDLAAVRDRTGRILVLCKSVWLCRVTGVAGTHVGGKV